MEKVTEELNKATEYIRAMKRAGTNKGDCDNLLMHLGNIENLVQDGLLSHVSESFRGEIQGVMEHHEKQEEKHAERKNYHNATYHSTTAAAMKEVLLRAMDYSR